MWRTVILPAPRTCIAFLLLLFSLNLLPAQSPRARIMVPEVSDEIEGRYNQVVADTVGLSLRQLGFTVVAGDAPSELEILIESAPYPPRLHLSISAYDTASGSLVAGVNGSGRTNVTLLNSIDQFLEELEPLLTEYKEYLSEPSNPFVPIAEVRQLRFRRQDNRPVEVSVRHGPRILRAEDEQAVVEGYPVTVGSELFLQYEAPYSQPRSELIQIEGPLQEIVIPELPDKERFSGQLHYSLGKMVGVGFGGRWYPFPDRAYTALETDLFMSGVGTGAPSQILHNEYRLLLGYRPGSAGSRFRLDLSAGFGVLISAPLVATASSYVDPYISVINLALEVRLRRLRPFARIGSNYVLSSDSPILQAGTQSAFFNPAVAAGLRYVW